MSIERSHHRRDAEAVADRRLDTRQAEVRRAETQREARPIAERADQFKAAMQRQAEHGPPPPDAERLAKPQEQPQLPGQKRPQASAEQNRLAERAATAAQENTSTAEQAASAQGLKERDLRRKEESGDASSSKSDSGSDIATMWQAQMALRNDATAMPAAPAPVNTQVFAELIQRHVRQMAASDRALQDSDGQVLLRMSDATLPGTDLLLSRTSGGWQLRADSRSRESYDAIRRAAPELMKRFADSDLGELTIDPHFHA